MERLITLIINRFILMPLLFIIYIAGLAWSIIWSIVWGALMLFISGITIIVVLIVVLFQSLFSIFD
jgi:hypothetical protein